MKMFIIDKILEKRTKKFTDKSLLNIEKVNSKLNQKPNANNYLDDDVILFI